MKTARKISAFVQPRAVLSNSLPIEVDNTSKLLLHLTKTKFRVAWIVVIFFHVFIMFYSVMLAYIYYYISLPDMDYYVQLLQLMPQENYLLVILFYAFIGLVNFFNALEMVFYSARYQRLVFRKTSTTRKCSGAIEGEAANSFFANFQAVRRLTTKFVHAVSVRGEWYDIVSLAQEIARFASLVVQAHSSSHLIASVPINQVLAALVFLNSFAYALVLYNSKENVGLRRLYAIVIDLMIDFVWGFIIPWAIISVYILTFNFSVSDEIEYSDTLLIKGILECKQFFMTSWLDAVTTAMPCMSMLLGLQNVKHSVRHEVAGCQSAWPHTTKSSSTLSRCLQNTIAPESHPSLHPAKVKHRCAGARLVRGVVALMSCCGLFVLLTSITATGIFFGDKSICEVGCKLRMRPWFTHRCACSVMEINCFERGITGREAETRSILQSLGPDVLNSLIITHCPELVITEEIRRFNNLMVLELYNATVLDWPSTASLSSPYFLSLTTVFFVRTRFVGGLPPGVTTDLSPSIVDVEFAASDLGGPLPDNLDKKWSSVIVLCIEHCELQEFPLVLTKMPATYISVVDNNISVIPNSSLNENVMTLLLDRNPLEGIPPWTNLWDLDVQYTNISSLPQWLKNLQTEGSAMNFRALGTPYCQSLPSDSYEAKVASCTTELVSDGIFPLAMRDEMRVIH